MADQITARAVGVLSDVAAADEIMQKLAETEDRWTIGEAWYGEKGRYSEMRDQLLAVIGERIKNALPQGAKVVEGAIERQAKADPAYKHFIGRHLRRRIAWLKLNEQREYLWAAYWREHAHIKNARFAGAA
jgi:hypothetical protein